MWGAGVSTEAGRPGRPEMRAPHSVRTLRLEMAQSLVGLDVECAAHLENILHHRLRLHVEEVLKHCPVLWNAARNVMRLNFMF